MLQIRLLGQFDIRLDGKRVTIPTRAAQSLFAYLVLTAGTPHRREKLAGTFWPDTTDENARKNLRQELWRIRKAFSAQQFSTDEYLSAEELTLTFNRNSEYWLDVAQLERPEIDLESLTANLSLYQGELLPGFYEDWIMLERERIQSIFETKMDQLLKQLVAAERWVTVQEQGERWLALGHTLEPAYRAIMLAYGARGDMAKVSSTYQRCIEELREQFGLEPSAETRALYDGLLKGTHAPVRSAGVQTSGTVTFLFTDIEESTNLLDKLGDQYANVLADHHEILRAAIKKWNGHEVDTQGDAFFVTFARAMDAIQCAAEAQRALDSHPWMHGKPLRVRMGLHTGEPLIASTGYVGMDVHRAARIGDAAHGGQVLLSQTTRELVKNDLPKDLSIRDLGEHRLKDLKFPTPIYQLIVPGLSHEFPPIRTKFTGSEAPTAGEPPFKGLQYFDEKDSELFFGREILTAKLVKRLQESQFLSVVIGASGSGKSSLVRAGLIPSLKKGQVLIDGTKPPEPPEGSSEWRVHIITPTAHPLEALAIELTRDSESITATSTLMDDLMQDPRSLALFLTRKYPKGHTLLVLDQFEELFTLCRDEFEREAFIDNLLTTLNQNERHVTLVLTLRADFYAHLAQYPELRDAVAKQQEYIGPMTTEELRRAIEEPAQRGHWAFEPGLVDLILRDVGDEPGALPLLSHALLETWKRRAGHTLTLKGYADAGGVHGAIAHTAESMYQNLSADEQAITRNIFLRLTELGDGTEDTRRRTSMAELTSHTDETDEVQAVLNLLAEARLITLGEDTVEVAHEALIREWPTLREWLTQDREGLLLHRQITEAAHEWKLLERDAGSVYRGARLAQAREWAILHPNSLNTGERAFIEASNELEQHEQIEREAQIQRELEAAKNLAETKSQSELRLRIRNRVITAVGIIAIVLAMLASLFGLSSRQNARKAQDNFVLADQQRNAAQNAQATAQAIGDLANKAAAISFSREMAVQAELNLNIDPERSILLALTGLDKTRTLEAENALHKAIYSSRLRMTLKGQKGPIPYIAYSPDGNLIASAGSDKTAKLWDTTTGKQLLSLQHLADVQIVLFSPDGTRLITSANDGLVRIWDVTSGKQLLSIVATNAIPPGNITFSVAISPNGKLLATSNADDGVVKFWDPTSGAELFTLNSPDWQAVAPGVDLQLDGLTFSPDGHLAITLTSFQKYLGRIEIWDVTTHQRGQTLSVHFDPYGPASFSPDGTRLVSVEEIHGAVWDVASGKLLFSFSPDRTVNRVRYSADGTRLLVAGGGGVAEVFDAETGSRLLAFPGNSGRVYNVAGSPDCLKPPATLFDWCTTRMVSVGDDDVIRIWDISPTGQQESLTVPGDDFSLSSDGTRLSTITYDQLSPQGGSAILIEQRTFPTSLGVDPTSGYTSTYIQSGEDSHDFAFFPNDGILAIPYENGPIKLWDITQGNKLVHPISCCTWTQDMVLAFSSRLHPRLAIAHADTGIVLIWDLVTDTQIQTLHVMLPNTPTALVIYSVLLSPDGERLVTLKSDATLETWDVKTGDKLLILPGPTQTPDTTELDFSPDGKFLLIADCSGTQVVRDIATGAEIRRFSKRGCTFGAAFSADNKMIAMRGPETKVFSLETGEEVLSLPIRGGLVLFSPDGTRLIAGVGANASDPATVDVFMMQLNDLVALAKTRVTRGLTTAECQQYLHMEACLASP